MGNNEIPVSIPILIQIPNPILSPNRKPTRAIPLGSASWSFRGRLGASRDFLELAGPFMFEILSRREPVARIS